MPREPRVSPSKIDQFPRSLQQAVQELARRRQLMETVLANIPTGVISLDAAGAILRVNTSVSRMFGMTSADPQSNSIERLLGTDSSRLRYYPIRTSLRLCVV